MKTKIILLLSLLSVSNLSFGMNDELCDRLQKQEEERIMLFFARGVANGANLDLCTELAAQKILASKQRLDALRRSTKERSEKPAAKPKK